MNEENRNEAKLLAISMAKIREFCIKHKDCENCPLADCEGNCLLIINCPSSWDVDGTLYQIGFYAGKEEGREA